MKILLATDGSQHSEGAATFLTCLNLSSDDEIMVFHAIYWIPFLYDREFYCETLKEIKMAIAPKILDSALNILRPVHAKISTTLTEGSPEEAIVDMARNSGMDIIVMGARGVRGIESLFVGSVTRSVSIKSPVPVLVTKLPVRKRPDKIRILFATDGSEYAMATEEFLSSMPFPDNTGITIVTVMPSEFLDIPETFVPEIIEKTIEIVEKAESMRRAESERIAEEAKEYLSTTFSNVNVLCEVGDPSKEILRVSDALRTDIIAVGCRGLRGIKGMMGSVSRNVLTHSKCSVLIGKTCKEKIT